MSVKKVLALDMSQPQGALTYYEGAFEKTWVLIDSDALSVLAHVVQNYTPDTLLLGIGPGRLSGLRSSASYLSGLAQSLGIPCVYTLPSLLIVAVYARQRYVQNDVRVVIDARMGQYFTARYLFEDNHIRVIQEPFLATHIASDTFTVGLLATQEAHHIDAQLSHMRFEGVLANSALWENALLCDPQHIALYYLRDAVKL